MADFETLNLTITADTAKASSSLDSLAKALGSVQTMLNSVDGSDMFNQMSNLDSGLSRLISTFSSLSTSMSHIEGIVDVMRTTATAVTTISSATQGLDGGNLQTLASGIDALSTSLSAASDLMGFARFDSAATNLEAFTSAITVLQGAMASFSSGVDTQSMNALATLASSLAQMNTSLGNGFSADSFAALASGINHVASATASIDDATVDRVIRLANALNQLAAAAAGAEGMENLKMPNLGGGGSNQSSAMQNVQKFLGGFTSEYAGGVKKLGSLLGGAVKTGGKAASAALQGVGSAAKFMYDKFSLSTLMGNNLLGSLMRMAKMRILRSIIRGIANSFKEGMENIAHYSAAANATLSQFSTGAQYVKNSLAASLYPAIASMVGIFNALISVVVRAMNIINMLFSMLGGKSTYTRATKQTKDFTTATGGAAGAASALKQELMGFDEINALSPSGGGGGGGGGGLADYASMFEEAPIEDWVQNMMDSGDFTMLGEKIAAKVNTALSKIKWTDIRAGAKKLANAIATAINGFVAEIDPSVIGETIAGVINTATTFVDHFWSTVNWTEMGSKVKKALLEALGKIDTTSLGRAITGKLRGMVSFINGWLNTGGKSVLGTIGTKVGETINAALSSLDAGELASAFVGVLQGAADGAVNLINTIDWDSLMEQVNKFLGDAIANAPWSTIAQAFVTLINKAVKYFTLPTTQANITNLTEKVATFVVNAINGIEWDKVGIALAGIANAIVKGLNNALGGSEGEQASASLIDGVKTFFSNIDFEAVIDLASIALNSGVGKALTLYAVASSLYKMIPSCTGFKIGAGIAFAIPGVFEITASISKLMQSSTTTDLTASIASLIGKALFGAAGAYVGFVVGGPMGAALGFTVGVTVATKIEDITQSEGPGTASYAQKYNKESLVHKVREYLPGIKAVSGTSKQIDRLTTSLSVLSGVKFNSSSTLKVLDSLLPGLSSKLTTGTASTEDINKAIDALMSDMIEAINNGTWTEYLQQLGLIGTEADGVESSVSTLGTTLGTTVDTATGDLDTLQQSVDGVSDSVSTLTDSTDTMPETIMIDGSSLDGVEESATEASKQVAGLSSMLTILQRAFNNFDGSFDTLKDSATNANDEVSTLKDTVKAIPDTKTVTLYTKNTTNVLNGLKKVKDAVNALSGVTITVKIKAGLTSGAKSFLTELKSAADSSTQTKISNLLRLSQFAKGGFPSSGDIFMANENGRQELVGRIGNQPAVANQDQIGDAIFKYMDQYGQGNGYDTEALASAIVRGIKASGLGATYLDGKQLATSINKETQRSGKPAIQF